MKKYVFLLFSTSITFLLLPVTFQPYLIFETQFYQNCHTAIRLFDRSVWSSRKAEIWVWPYYLVMVTVSDYGNYVTVASRQVLLSWRSPGRGSSSSAQSVARQLPATSKGHGRGTVTLWFYVSYRFVKILTYLCGLSWTTVCSCQDCIYTQ